MRPRFDHARYLITEFRKKLHLDKPFDEITDFDVRFRAILRRHMAWLGWWSILNFVAGMFAIAFTSGWLYYFLMMGMVWGLINFAVVMLVFDHAFFQKFKKGSSFERFEVQRHVEKLLALNIGFDFSYFFIGFLLREHSYVCNVAHPDLWFGFGWSIIVQGAYLILHDISFYNLHLINFTKAAPFLRRELELTGD